VGALWVPEPEAEAGESESETPAQESD